MSLTKKYKLTCKYCGCEFEAERYELSPKPIGIIQTEYGIDRYENDGRETLIACPECGNMAKCLIPITDEERETLEFYRNTIRWKKYD